MEGRELTRREWFRLSGAAGAAGMFGGPLHAGESLVPAMSAVDHLLLGIGDLDRGIAWVKTRSGVKAVVGGSHPGGGTRNALLSLGGRRYLEILAPDPAQSAYNFPIDVRKLIEPRLITWAAGTTDIEATAKRARQSRYETFGPRAGSRTRPDGKVLEWKILGVPNKLGRDGVEPIPFFIEWAAGSLHPSEDSPKGCELQSLEIHHPDPVAVTEMLKKLGIEADVKQAERAQLRAGLAAPKGAVVLS
jgi:hypothetical protein